MQQLEVSLSIPIPADSILISKVELEELKKNQFIGLYWTMKDLEKRTGKKIEWLKENILYKPQFRKELDSKNGGFVFYPERNGQTWAFQSSKMANFLDDNFQQIFNPKEVFK